MRLCFHIFVDQLISTKGPHFEGYVTGYLVGFSHSLLLHCCLVCRGANNLSFLSYLLKPGNLFPSKSICSSKYFEVKKTYGVLYYLMHKSMILMQTTYENFRYRYSKKDNPYHQGIKKNLVEVFFSKIPPSLNDFRAYIEDDSLVMDLTTPNLENSPKEKIDIESVNTLSEAGSFSLPQILQNLHNGEGNENTRSKLGTGASDTLPSPFLFETNIAATDLAIETKKSEDGANAEQKHDEETIKSDTHTVHQI